VYDWEDGALEVKDYRGYRLHCMKSLISGGEQSGPGQQFACALALQSQDIMEARHAMQATSWLSPGHGFAQAQC
jgi:hypothetical protein